MKHNAATWRNKAEYEELERSAMIETIAEMQQTIKVLTTAIETALDDPANWRAHVEPALEVVRS